MATLTSPGAELTNRCPSCGVVARARILGQDPKHLELEMVDPDTSFVCDHWCDVQTVIGDLAAGLDPAERCGECGENPCAGPRGPGSCLRLTA